MNRTKMRTLFRSLIDESNTGSVIFPDARINELLYEGAQQVQDLLEDVDEHLFETERVESLDAGTTSLALVDTFRKLKQLYRAEPSGSAADAFQLEYIDPRQIPEYRRNGRANDAFTLRNNTILFIQPLASATTFTIVHTFHVADLGGDTEQWADIPSYARRLVVYEAVYIGLVSENSDTDKFISLLSDVRTKVLRATENRVDTGSRGIRDET